MTNRTTRNAHAIAGISTPEADAAFADYCARRDAIAESNKDKTMAQRCIEMIGEELARERFPHYFA